MKHPIFSGSGFRTYVLVWGVISLIQFSFLLFYLDFPFKIASLDSIVHNAVFAIFGTGLWYVVRYASLNKDELALAATHIGAALITILPWSFISNLILHPMISTSDKASVGFFSLNYVWRWIVGVAYYCVTVLVFYLVKYYYDMKDQLKMESELQVLLKDAELRMLKSQINPHFIFNSLNSISALTISKSESAREMIIKLSEFLRYSLGKSSLEMNTMEEEIKSAVLYLAIEKVRFGDKLKFEKEVSKECLEVRIPNLILQPILENATKYGVYDSTDQSIIRLTCKVDQDLLYIAVINTYDPNAISRRGEGVGLENVRRRLALIYGRSDLLEVSKEGGQFEVTMKIPISSQA